MLEAQNPRILDIWSRTGKGNDMFQRSLQGSGPFLKSFLGPRRGMGVEKPDTDHPHLMGWEHVVGETIAGMQDIDPIC